MVGLMRHNKVFSMVFSIVSIFILMFSMVFPHSKASADVLTSEKYNNKGWVFSKHLGFFVETDLIRLADGRIAYCLDERLSSPNGNDLEPMGRLSDEAYRVMAYGYPEKQPSELGASNWQEAHFGTQVALWVVNTDISYNDLRFDNPRVKAVVDNILNDVRTKDTTQDLTFDVSPTSHVAHVEGDYFKAGAFKVTTNAKGGSYTPQAINAPKGTYFTNANGEQKTTFNSNEDFYVYFNKNEASGTFQIKVSGDLTKTETIWYKSHDAGVQNSLALVTTKHTPVQENLSVNWASKGSLELNKVDENGTKLAGAKFDVKNAKGETVATITTDENGYGKVDNLDLGTYTVVETQAPNGYVLDATPQKAQVNNGEVANIKFVNKLAKGEIEINKVDDSNKPLAGVEFTVYNEKGEEITKVVTDKNGKAFVKDLAFGKYSFKETKGLDGYIGSTETYNFEVKENGKVQTFTVTNKLVKGSIEIHKVDDNKKPLSDVEFTVYNEKGEEVTKVVTDKNGIASVKDLPYGKYTFKETKAKNGYEGSSEEISFEITKQGSNQVFNVVNKLVKGSIEINKTGDNKQPLEGVEFTIYDEKGNALKEVITDKNGIAKSGDLPYGSYHFKETKAKTGYVINKQKFDFDIKTNGQTLKFDVTNKLIKGSIEITKVNEENQPLQGVEFTVYDQNNKKIKTVVTDKDGKAKVDNLIFGKYYFKETKTIEGYVINNQKFDFSIEENAKTLPFTVTNKVIKGNVKLVKVDADNEGTKLK
ncbi:SpaA isopeptide-forming pilin-related protein, partial [Bacillus cereus group sp. BfR-BA-01441]|uniref:SpaA isopeptide-forming pilin-related protein n=1 Tax=Bacillus cereus group sp. BfR-BA-01441 TaxID=2920348 RepID=UPI001F598A03